MPSCRLTPQPPAPQRSSPGPVLILMAVMALSGCGGGGANSNPPAPATLDRLVDFSGAPACIGSDADYQANTPPPDVVSAARPLPTPFSGTGGACRARTAATTCSSTSSASSAAFSPA